MRKRIGRPVSSPEHLHLRLPEGTLALIDRLRGDERQGDYVRSLLVPLLQGLAAGKVEMWVNENGHD